MYPYTEAQVLTDDLFVAYGGLTGTTTELQREAAYLVAEKWMSTAIGTFVVDTTITGTYYYPQSNLTLKVYLENGFVRYNLKDSLGGQLITYKENISTYQKWAFFIDENKSLWVLSSDIGNTWWRRDTDRQLYTYIRIDHLFDKSTIPKDVYQEIKEFLR